MTRQKDNQAIPIVTFAFGNSARGHEDNQVVPMLTVWLRRRAMNEMLEQVGTITLICPKCGADIVVPTYRTLEAVPVAVIGLSVVFDPPGYKPPKDWIPEEIRCKLCKTVYGV